MLTLVVQACVLKFGLHILQIIIDITIQGLSTDRVKEHFFLKKQAIIPQFGIFLLMQIPATL